MIVGLLHPGEMGAAIGDALRAGGHDVIWASEGRSEDTRARATGLRDVGMLDALVGPGDLDRLDAAFFTTNGVISVAFFGFVLFDVL